MAVNIPDKSGSSDKNEPRLRGQHTRRRNQKEITPALFRSASEGFLPLDKDLSWKSRYRTFGVLELNERGEQNVGLVNIEKIARVLKPSLSELFRSV
jgi:hypothetical protein